MNNSDLQKKINEQLRDEARILGTRPLIYRIDDKKTGADATVCLLLELKTLIPVARGVAMRSPKDQSFHKVGSNLALGRALKAFYNGENKAPILPNNPNHSKARPEHIAHFGDMFAYKREFRPVLNDIEVQLVNKLRQSREKAATLA